jgi:Glyoxalase-like domain
VELVKLSGEVPDLEKAHTRVLKLGATLLHIDARGWRVFADPAGHPFCLLQGRHEDHNLGAWNASLTVSG